MAALLIAILEPDQVVYYWHKTEATSKKTRAERISRSRPGHVRLKGGALLPCDQVFASREEALASGSNGGTELASGSNGGTSLATGHVEDEQPSG